MKTSDKLTPLQKKVLFEKATEAPFSGEYDQHFEPGSYSCANCGQVLFDSEQKYDASCGWPAFTQAIEKNWVKETPDHSHGMERIEVTCSQCGGHLGHVFPDGPGPTFTRYCINSASLNFTPKKIR